MYLDRTSSVPYCISASILSGAISVLKVARQVKGCGFLSSRCKRIFSCDFVHQNFPSSPKYINSWYCSTILFLRISSMSLSIRSNTLSGGGGMLIANHKILTVFFYKNLYSGCRSLVRAPLREEKISAF